jgi:hypothetical protein
MVAEALLLEHVVEDCAVQDVVRHGSIGSSWRRRILANKRANDEKRN